MSAPPSAENKSSAHALNVNAKAWVPNVAAAEWKPSVVPIAAAASANLPNAAAAEWKPSNTALPVTCAIVSPTAAPISAAAAPISAAPVPISAAPVPISAAPVPILAAPVLVAPATVAQAPAPVVATTIPVVPTPSPVTSTAAPNGAATPVTAKPTFAAAAASASAPPASVVQTKQASAEDEFTFGDVGAEAVNTSKKDTSVNTVTQKPVAAVSAVVDKTSTSVAGVKPTPGNKPLSVNTNSSGIKKGLISDDKQDPRQQRTMTPKGSANGGTYHNGNRNSSNNTPRGNYNQGGGNFSQPSGGAKDWARKKTLFYEKYTMLTVFTKGIEPPAEIVAFYGEAFCKDQREPANKLPEVDDRIHFAPRKKDPEDSTSPEYIYKMALTTFNKLSPDNFDKILEKFLVLGIEKEKSLFSRIIELIVMKAQLEPTFCDMYVRFCKRVQDRIGAADSALGAEFREQLLENCKNEFEKNREDAFAEIDSREGLTAEEKEEKRYVLKLRYIGHMQFIGELYQYDMVTATIMRTCIDTLFESTEEEKLVCVCKLLQVIGKKLEAHDIQKKKSSKFRRYLELMQAKSEDTVNYSSRIRFMFKDLIELQQNNWQPRNEPEKQAKTTSAKQPEGMPGLQKPHSSDARMQQADASDGWNTVSVQKKKTATPTASANSQSSAGFHSASARGRGGGAGSTSGRGGPMNGTGRQPVQSNNIRGNGMNDVRKGGANTDKSPRGQASFKTIRPQDSTESMESSTTSDIDSVIASLPGNDGTVDRDTLKRVQGIAGEFLLNQMLGEAIEVLKGMIHPNGMADVVKTLMNFIVERKESDHEKFCPLLPALREAKMLSVEQFNKGLVDFLHGFDETVIDVPFAGKATASVLSSFLLHKTKCFEFSIFSNIPDENDFSMSPKFADLICQILLDVTTKADVASAQEVFSSAPGLLEIMITNSSKDRVDQLADDHKLPFLKC